MLFDSNQFNSLVLSLHAFKYKHTPYNALKKIQKFVFLVIDL